MASEAYSVIVPEAWTGNIAELSLRDICGLYEVFGSLTDQLIAEGALHHVLERF